MDKDNHQFFESQNGKYQPKVKNRPRLLETLILLVDNLCSTLTFDI